MGLSEATMVAYALGSLGCLVSVRPGWRFLRQPSAWTILAGFVLHTASLAAVFFRDDILDLTKGDLLWAMAWSLILAFSLAWRRLRWPFLWIGAGPLALGLYAVSVVIRNVESGLPETMTGWFFLLHLAAMFVNLALLSLGFGSALVFCHLHRSLKSKRRMPEPDEDAPALAVLDRFNRAVVLIGFPLYTVGLLAGFLWAGLGRQAWITSDPKEIVSVLLWLLYGAVFLQRAFLGWRGRRAAVMLVILFSAALASLVGVNVFMDSHHNFFQTGMF